MVFLRWEVWVITCHLTIRQSYGLYWWRFNYIYNEIRGESWWESRAVLQPYGEKRYCMSFTKKYVFKELSRSAMKFHLSHKSKACALYFRSKPARYGSDSFRCSVLGCKNFSDRTWQFFIFLRHETCRRSVFLESQMEYSYSVRGRCLS